MPVTVTTMPVTVTTVPVTVTTVPVTAMPTVRMSSACAQHDRGDHSRQKNCAFHIWASVNSVPERLEKATAELSGSTSIVAIFRPHGDHAFGGFELASFGCGATKRGSADPIPSTQLPFTRACGDWPKGSFKNDFGI
jgi:hypothetical protein